MGKNTLKVKKKGCNPARPLQESPGPSGPGIPKESPKSLPGPSGPRVQKVSETVSKQSPESQNRLFRDSGDCFETVSDAFWTPGPEGPGRLFGDSFGIPGPEGPGDSCKGRAGLQKKRGIQGVFREFQGVFRSPFRVSCLDPCDSRFGPLGNAQGTLPY